MTSEMMTFHVIAHRQGTEGSIVRSKNAELMIATSMAGRLDALNPVELLLASLAACIIKGIERVAVTLGIEYESVDVALTAHRRKPCSLLCLDAESLGRTLRDHF